MSEKQKILENLEAYPERPKVFAIKYGRFLAESQAAKEIGINGALLLMFIALEEDRRRCNPATLRNGELRAAMGGYSERCLIDLRDKLEELGWLYQRKGNRFRAAAYWVKIPPEHEQLWQSICGEGNFPSTGESPVDGKLMGNRPSVETSAYIPSPNPEPKSSPPPQPKANPQRAAVVEELSEQLKAAGVEIDPDRVIARSLAQGRTAEQIRSRIQFYLDHKSDTSAAWNPGFLVFSLTNKSLIGTPADEGWPKPNPEWAAKIASKQRRKQDDSARRTVAKTRTEETELLKKQWQLQFDFEAHLKGKSIDQIAEFVPIPAEVHNRLKQYQNWEHVRSRAPVELVVNVLELVSKHYDPLRRLN